MKHLDVASCGNETDFVSNSRKIMDFSPPEPSLDGVYAYGVEMLSLGLFYMLFKDAINSKEVLRCWKYFVPIFKASGCTNYSTEASVYTFT